MYNFKTLGLWIELEFLLYKNALMEVSTFLAELLWRRPVKLLTIFQLFHFGKERCPKFKQKNLYLLQLRYVLSCVVETSRKSEKVL